MRGRRAGDMLVQTDIATEEVKAKEVRCGEAPYLLYLLKYVRHGPSPLPLWDTPHSQSLLE
jgi:hypothetical protein